MSAVGHNKIQKISHFLLQVLRGRYSWPEKLHNYLKSLKDYCKLEMRFFLRITKLKNWKTWKTFTHFWSMKRNNYTFILIFTANVQHILLIRGHDNQKEGHGNKSSSAITVFYRFKNIHKCFIMQISKNLDPGFLASSDIFALLIFKKPNSRKNDPRF